MPRLEKADSVFSDTETDIGSEKKVVLYIFVILACIALLLMAVMDIYYTDIDKTKTIAEAKGIDIGYEKGVKDGYSKAVKEIITITRNCSVAGLTVGDISLNVTNIECWVKE